MNIDRVNISNHGVDRSQAAQPAEVKPSPGKEGQAPSGSDSVAISSRATDLNRLATAIEHSRAERFEQIRALLEAGTYHVSGKELAEKLIDSNKK